MSSALEPEEALFAGTPAERRAALDELVRRFSRRLFALARHLVCSGELAEELVQESFVRLWQRAVQPPAGAPPVTRVYGYLRRVLVNLSMHQHRLDSAVGGGAEDLPGPLDLAADGQPGPAERVIQMESAGRCLAAMAHLPPEQRLVLALRVLEGRSYQELADELGWPIGTVMSRLHRARLAVAAAVDPESTVAEPCVKTGGAVNLRVRRSG
jgi:RNA polymerase sigma-70 factor (ECF subfamily)